MINIEDWKEIAMDGLPEYMVEDWDGNLCSRLLLTYDGLGTINLAYYTKQYDIDGNETAEFWVQYETGDILHEPTKYIEIDTEELI